MYAKMRGYAEYALSLQINGFMDKIIWDDQVDTLSVMQEDRGHYWTIHRVERSASIACDVIGFQRILWLFIGKSIFHMEKMNLGVITEGVIALIHRTRIIKYVYEQTKVAEYVGRGQERFLLDVSMEMVVWLPVIVILMGSKKSIQALMNEYTSIIRYFTFYTTSNYRLCCVLQVRNESGTMHGRIARYSEIKQNNQVRKLWIGTGTSSGLPYPRTSSGPHPTKCILLPEAYRS
ncbi:hypothetical protein BDB01DRAFT_900722 [Pilobolus umbonatus]|nr:hypothetical protein BDB01DRAFT_900722 [Pilobolus umbonatus]